MNRTSWPASFVEGARTIAQLFSLVLKKCGGSAMVVFLLAETKFLGKTTKRLLIVIRQSMAKESGHVKVAQCKMRPN